MISFIIPIRVISEANRCDHWSVKRKRTNEHRLVAKCKTNEHLPRSFNFMGKVKLTRVYTGRQQAMDLGDNLACSMKACRDGIADALKRDDRNIVWEYAQERGDHIAVRVEIT